MEFMGDRQWRLASQLESGEEVSANLPLLSIDGVGYWMVATGEEGPCVWQGNDTEPILISDLLTSAGGSGGATLAK